MPISLTPYAQGDLCHGSTWKVPDEDQLADYVARIAIGQSRHVERILAGLSLGAPSTSQAAAKGARALLTVKGDDPWHRDGWLFQAMSWVAANCAAPGGVIRAPHMILAHKGFDGLQLEIDAAGSIVTAAVIFEDKATDNPRDTVRDKIWPDFRGLESGAEEHVLTAEVTSLLRTVPGLDADAAVETIIWKDVRRYRVAITVGDTHGSVSGRAQLFAGYDEVAPGDNVRRRGETFQVSTLRPWMQNLAERSIAFVDNWAASHV
jgi:hypothetical protein